jgi:hypothetical protein
VPRHHENTARSLRHAFLAIVATGMLSGCPLGGPGDDAGATGGGGSGRDSGVSNPGRDSGTNSGRDAGGTKDTGQEEEEEEDAGEPKVDAGKDAGVPKDSGTPKDAAVDGGIKDGGVDAGPSDPAVAGSDAPTLSAVGYYDDDIGLRILLKGRDPNGDVASYTVKFFNGASPVGFDIDNDEDSPSVDSFTGTLTSAPGDAAFFGSFEPTREFADAVDTIKITVRDSGGRTSAELVARRGVPATTTYTCDPLGFNRCTTGNVCTRNGTSHRCAPLTQVRTSACNAALVLDPKVSASVIGHVDGPSLWDAPEGCSSNDPKLKPDAVVKLHLTSPASKVTLTTNHAATDFDTALYLLASCGSEPPACVDETCACSDDTAATASTPATNRSTLVLRNLPTGDHLIVVDAFPSSDMSGDTFELSALVE